MKSRMTLPEAKADCKRRFNEHIDARKRIDPKGYVRGYFSPQFTKQIGDFRK